MLTLILIDDQYVHDVVLNFEKIQMVKMTPRLIPTTQQKKILSAKFPIAPNYFRTPLLPISSKREFFEKTA